MAVYNRLGDLQLNLDRFQGTLNRYMVKSNGSTTGSSTKKPGSRLKKLQAEMQLDAEAITGQIQAMNAQMVELREQDRRLQHAEDAFDNATRAMFTALRRERLLNDDENSDTTSEISLAPSSAFRSITSAALAPPISPDLEEYYKAVSEMRNMQERFHWLIAERDEQWERRAMLEEQGQCLDQTDDEFIKAWEKQLDEAEANYEDAGAAVESARRVCETADIVIPDWAEDSSVNADNKQQHFYPLHEATIIPPNIEPPPQLFDGMVPETLPQDHSSPTSSSHIVRQLKEKRVSEWVEDVVPSGAFVSLGDSKKSPMDGIEIDVSMSRLTRHHNSRTTLMRSTSCPALPRASDRIPMASTRHQPPHGLGVDQTNMFIQPRGLNFPL